MVFAGQRKVIFVHGCFWHRHGSCKLTRWPKSKLDFWRPKLEQNHERDKVNKRKLVWECQLNKVSVLTVRLSEFLERQ
jgi:DNA mismatch endonuclease, patch repair protein